MTVNMVLSRNGCAIPRDLAEIISKYWIFLNVFALNRYDAVTQIAQEAGLL